VFGIFAYSIAGFARRARHEHDFAAIPVRVSTRPGWMGHLFAAALVASAILLLPQASHGSLIIPWSIEPSAPVDLEQLSLGVLDDGFGSGSSRGVADRALQEKAPAPEQPRSPQDRDVWTATDGAGGASNTVPQGGTSSGAPGDVVGGPALGALQVSGVAFSGQSLTVPSPVPEDLLDPPRIPA